MVMVKIINTNQKVYLKTYGENHDAIFNRCGKCVHFESYASIYDDDDEDYETGLCNFATQFSARKQVGLNDSCPNFKRRSEK